MQLAGQWEDHLAIKKFLLLQSLKDFLWGFGLTWSEFRTMGLQPIENEYVMVVVVVVVVVVVAVAVAVVVVVVVGGGGGGTTTTVTATAAAAVFVSLKASVLKEICLRLWRLATFLF